MNIDELISELTVIRARRGNLDCIVTYADKEAELASFEVTPDGRKVQLELASPLLGEDTP